MKKLLLILLIVTIFCGCEKEEEPFTPKVQQPQDTTQKVGEIVIRSVDLTSNYKYQIFYSLETNSPTSTNLKTDWDIRYREDGTVITNTSTASSVATSNADFVSLTSTNNLTFDYDRPGQSKDSLMISNPSLTYIINRGFDTDAKPRGYIKFHYSISNEVLSITVNSLDNSKSRSYQLTKGNDLSFDNGVVNIFPNDNNWDLLFTQYIHLFSPTSPYTVTGALLNTNKWSATTFSSKDFYDITLSDVTLLTYNNLANTIGYDWKTYSFETSSYTTDDTKVFILKNRNGNFYKLRFLDFHSSTTGEKGSPKFEYQQL